MSRLEHSGGQSFGSKKLANLHVMVSNKRNEKNRKREVTGFEQDDRTIIVAQGSSRRLPLNNPHRRNKVSSQHGWNNQNGVQDELEDIVGVSRRNNERFNNFNRKRYRGYHRTERTSFKKYLPRSPSFWYKVTIRQGYCYNKDYLLNLLTNYIKPVPLIPLSYEINNNDLTFIIENHTSAEELYRANRRIGFFNICKLSLEVKSYNPVIELNEQLIKTMEKVVTSRYNQFTKALDLTEFHHDQNFLEEHIFCPLNVESVMNTVIDIMQDSTPDLIALDISKSNLFKLHIMNSIVDKFPSIRILNIGKNKLRDIKQLDALKGLKLEEIELNGNSFCDKFNEKDEYIREVRARFPKIIKLDGVDLPPPILFDVGEDECKLPSSLASFMCDPDNGPAVVRGFLEQYYQMYDSDSRESLAHAYEEDAQFSLDCYVTPKTHSSIISAYLHCDRNLFKITSSEKRMKLLKVGKKSVVETLKRLPKTQHDPASFIVDLVLLTTNFIQLNVCGLFKEKNKNNAPDKYFNRSFIIISRGSGFCITNDLLTIMPATEDQIRKLAKLKETTAAVVDASSSNKKVIQLAIATKQQMVTTLAKKSGMNICWSEKCLTETNWDLDQALNAFFQLQDAGNIPVEAFEK